ncbi:hypothetical protein E1B28_006891 [Marasmius oreades]|uniref:BTB domain-containing protein n=1 Tax=Marasmius oreades TaxID=181124 RepID=A0A9P7S0H9_9AGAR|nr:uncharacterized protein E1B28_006891 [Marasmius oreades]KAG7093204.1 hypothetical protein E1B28_006891 [Marasmius oreades]
METGFPVSTTFGPVDPNTLPPDMTLISNDSVVFYTHEATLFKASTNHFNNLLPFPTPAQHDPSERILTLPEISSSELQIMLLAIYKVPAGDPSFSLVDINTLIRAIDHLPNYGFSPKTQITPTSQMYRLMLSCAPLYPLEIYALAAQYEIHAIAVTASSHTLVLPLSEVSAELSRRMGAIYLLWLFQLHMGRTERLKVLLTAEVGLHNPTAECSFTNQKTLKRMWNLAVAKLLFAIKAGERVSALGLGF